MGFPGGSDGKEYPCSMGDRGSIPGLGRTPGGRAWQPTPVFLSGESPWTEEPGKLQSKGSQRVEHAHLADSLYCTAETTQHC